MNTSTEKDQLPEEENDSLLLMKGPIGQVNEAFFFFFSKLKIEIFDQINSRN